MRTSKGLAVIILTGALTAACRNGSTTGTGDLAGVIPTVVAAATRTTYGGPCPPAAERAPSFQAIISVPAGPVTVTYEWVTGTGGSPDSGPRTIQFPYGGPQHVAISFTETGYLPDQTWSDWIAVHITSPVKVRSNHVTFTTSCHTGRPHRLEPREGGTLPRPVY